MFCIPNLLREIIRHISHERTFSILSLPKKYISLILLSMPLTDPIITYESHMDSTTQFSINSAGSIILQHRLSSRICENMSYFYRISKPLLKSASFSAINCETVWHCIKKFKVSKLCDKVFKILKLCDKVFKSMYYVFHWNWIFVKFLFKLSLRLKFWMFLN